MSNRELGWILTVVVVALIASWFLVGCAGATDVLEAACVKGRLGSAQALAINALPWERAPGYCRGNTYTDDRGVVHEGQADCTAREGDRVVSATCAQALRVLEGGD